MQQILVMKRIIKLFVNVGLILSSAGAYAQLIEYRYASIKMVTPVTTIKARTTDICTANLLASADKVKHTQGIAGKTKEYIAAENMETERKSIANFNIVGQPYVMFAITLPASFTIGSGAGMITGQIFINSFSSVNILGPHGTQMLGIGANLGTAKAPFDSYFDAVRIPVTVNYY